MVPLLDNVTLHTSTFRHLSWLYSQIVSAEGYPQKVARAQDLWSGKAGTQAGKDAFADVRAKLKSISRGIHRCAYCGDSRADEIEHVNPKVVLPLETFVWMNFVYVCGPCNGKKRDKFAYIDNQSGEVVKFSRRRGEYYPPPCKDSAFINPRLLDFSDFADLDFGLNQNGIVTPGTFFVVEKGVAGQLDHERAKFTIDAIDLNGDVFVEAREQAFHDYLLRIREFYRQRVAGNVPRETICIENMKKSPHPFVLYQMFKKQTNFDELSNIFQQCPDLFGKVFL